MEPVYTAQARSSGDARNGRIDAPGLDQATADRLAEAAHQLCPYSRATRGNIPVQVTAVV